MILTQQAHVVAVDAQTLTLGFANSGARDSFDNGGSPEIVRQAAIDVVGHDWRIETIVDPGGEQGAVPARTAPPAATPAQSRPAESRPAESRPAESRPAEVDQAPDWAQPSPAPPASETPELAGDDAPAQDRPIDSARQAISQGRPAAVAPADATGGARPDDDELESSGLAGAQLLQETLGAEVIEEIPHS
jgi:DNA polymerase-3 subunit gamma/tau